MVMEPLTASFKMGRVGLAMPLNIGMLVEPVTQADYMQSNSDKQFPRALFAHNIQQQSVQSFFAPYNRELYGLLGRDLGW